MWGPLRHSLRWQIQLYYTTLVILILGVLAFGCYYYEKRSRIQAIDNELAAMMLPALPHLLPTVMGLPSPGAGRNGQPVPHRPPDRNGKHTPIADIPTLRQMLERDPFYQRLVKRAYAVMFAGDGTLFFSSANAPEDPEFKPYPPGEQMVIRWSEGRREVVRAGPPDGLQVVLGVSVETLHRELQQLALTLTLIALSAGLLFTVLGWVLLDRGLRPIREISNTARKISEGDLQERIPTDHIQNELGPLAGLLNATFSRLDESLQAQRRYNADASHELRTPLSIILADCDYSLKRDRPPERYLKTIRICRETAEHMAILVEDLNLLAKADASALRLKKGTGDLAKLLREIADLTAPLLHEKAIELTADLAPAPASFDPNLMRQVCVNLIGNAVTYNRASGKILVRTGRAGTRCFVEIEDTGQGIAPADLSHVFDRFYRADKARGHVAGQTGLGLAITHTILEAHGGTISVRSEVGVGTCFRMELPPLA